MKTLLKKEFTFSANILTYIFIAAALMTFIPGYPILCGPFFVCMGIFYTFQSAREGNDILFSSLLPVKKGDVVRARYIFSVIIEAIAFAVIVAVTFIRMFLISDAAPYVNNALMNANLMSLGFALLIFAAFNMFFIGGFWKDAYKIGKPFLVSCIVTFLILGVGETLHHLPGLMALNTPMGMLEIQLPILIASVIIYIVTTIISCDMSVKSFERIDLTL
ncbi:MAG: ABC-2 transporter permease [Lachnospiraceae bacterium]|nr:ABC-2 transporter permease [Lachnospiraceae bacterium]